MVSAWATDPERRYLRRRLRSAPLFLLIVVGCLGVTIFSWLGGQALFGFDFRLLPKSRLGSFAACHMAELSLARRFQFGLRFLARLPSGQGQLLGGQRA